MRKSKNSLHDVAVRIASDLISIESVNPMCPGGQRGEGAAVEYVEGRLHDLHIPHDIIPVENGRKNILGTIRGKDRNRSLILEAHLDTATLNNMPDGLNPVIQGGNLRGRGAVDAKGCFACMLAALESLNWDRQRPPVNVQLLGSCDEESGLLKGIDAFIHSNSSQQFQVVGVVVGEPTDCQVIRAHRGAIWFDLVVKGKSAHGSEPEKGINAIQKMCEFLVRLNEKLSPKIRNLHTDDLMKNAELNVGIIQGGLQRNIVPDLCRVGIDRRIVPGETEGSVLREFEEFIDDCKREIQDLDISLLRTDSSGKNLPFVPPFKAPPKAKMVMNAQLVLKKLGLEVEQETADFTTHAAPLADRGYECVVFGPGEPRYAHSAEEQVPLKELGFAAEFFRNLIFENW